jgi:hypothetical protein
MFPHRLVAFKVVSVLELRETRNEKREVIVRRRHHESNHQLLEQIRNASLVHIRRADLGLPLGHFRRHVDGRSSSSVLAVRSVALVLLILVVTRRRACRISQPNNEFERVCNPAAPVALRACAVDSFDSSLFGSMTHRR